MYAEVVIPGITVDELTYLIPKGISLKIGEVVEVGIRKEVKKGVVVRTKRKTDLSYTRSILKNSGMILPLNLIRLSKWLKDKYLCFWGESLKLFFPSIPEKPTKLKREKIESDIEIHSEINAFIKKRERKPINIRGDLTKNELIEIIKKYKKGLILFPYINQVNSFYEEIQKNFNSSSIVKWHSEIGKKGESIWNDIYEGKVNVVIGTRSALFLPLTPVNFIAVLEEGNSVYKEVHHPPYYDAVDVSYKKAELEGSELFLSDIIPSFQSTERILSNKNYFIVKNLLFKGSLNLINMLQEKGNISEKAKEGIKKEKVILLIHPYKGYASRIVCKDCGTVIKCEECGTPLIIKEKFKPYCPVCKKFLQIERCPVCKGTLFKVRKYGTGRISEILRKLKNNVLEISGGTRKKDIENIKKITKEGGIIIGTESLIRFISEIKPDLTIFSNIDSLIFIHDYNGYYRTFYLIKDSLKNSKRVIAQTYSIESKFFSFVENLDIKGFLEWEMERRKTLNYPPFSIMVTVTVIAFKENVATGVANEIVKTIKSYGLSPQGPVLSPHIKHKGEKRMLIMIKCNEKEIESLRKLLLFSYNRVKIKLDVNPYELW